MLKKPHQQNVYTAITFQGVTVKVLQIHAKSQKEAEMKLITAHNKLRDVEALKVDDIMKHQSEWSFAVFDPKKIKSI